MNKNSLLIYTQKVNKDDPILGFFHSWIEALAPHYQKVLVCCLEEGSHDLPDNVTVFSLGKEKVRSKFQYIKNFFHIAFFSRNKYQKVFVHMNEEYVLLGGLIWRLLGKKISLWRNHVQGTWKTRLAVALSHEVFCTSPTSYTAQFKKTKIMPVGINEEVYKEIPGIRKQNSLLYVGRISPIKNIEVMIDALYLLKKEGIEATLDLYGPNDDAKYSKILSNKIKELYVSDRVKFCGSVKPAELAHIYSSYGVCINTTNSGSFDKTILEAAFCGCLPVASHDNFSQIIDAELKKYISFKEGDAESLSETIKTIISLNDYALVSERIAQTAKNHHGLKLLVSMLIKQL
jgi:glycosyltransferase involved in cell wall biosynthesis